MEKIKNCGFTLIEVLTVSGIMALFSITLISILLASFRGGGKAQLLQQIHQDGDFAIKAITREVRRADEVVCGVGNLTLTMPYGGTPIEYTLSAGKVASNGASLTGEVGLASALSFSCIDGNSGSQIVTIRFTLTAGGAAGSQAQEKLTQNFATSVSTRQQ